MIKVGTGNSDSHFIVNAIFWILIQLVNIKLYSLWEILLVEHICSWLLTREYGLREWILRPIATNLTMIFLNFVIKSVFYIFNFKIYILAHRFWSLNSRAVARGTRPAKGATRGVRHARNFLEFRPSEIFWKTFATYLFYKVMTIFHILAKKKKRKEEKNKYLKCYRGNCLACLIVATALNSVLIFIDIRLMLYVLIG
jgi:hypothetical protein